MRIETRSWSGVEVEVVETESSPTSCSSYASYTSYTSQSSYTSYSSQTSQSSLTSCTLYGTYTRQELEATGVTDKYYFTGDKFWQFCQSPVGKVLVNPFRAWFTGNFLGTEAPSRLEFCVMEDEGTSPINGETTGMTHSTTTCSDNSGIYLLSGQQISTRPSHGLYIDRGKVVLR